jgi:signal transduction histidine kinase
VAVVAHIRSAAQRTVGGLPVVDVGAALILSVAGVFGILVRQPEVTPTAAVGVLAMTVPVAWCRRAPVAAAAALAVGALANGVLYPSVVRCGVALPAVFIVGYFVAARLDRSESMIGLGLCSLNVLAQSIWDPRLGAPVVALLLPLLVMFFALGAIARSRTASLDALRDRTAELRLQRDRTAELAVRVDQARVSEELDTLLRDRIAEIAAAGRAALHAEPETAADTLVAIEATGRDVLQRLREIVGSLDRVAPSTPPPSLAELPLLLERATAAATRLTVEGDHRRLPVALELAGYRIAEHLVTALEDTPGATIEVRLRYADEAFELHMAGPPGGDSERAAAVAAAGERAALHGGTLDHGTTGRLWHTTARLPLVSVHA